MTASDFVTVANLTLPRAAVHAAIDAELRGVRLRADGNTLVVTPGGVLGPEELNALRRWKSHVLALINVCNGAEVQ